MDGEIDESCSRESSDERRKYNKNINLQADSEDRRRASDHDNNFLFYSFHSYSYSFSLCCCFMIRYDLDSLHRPVYIRSHPTKCIFNISSTDMLWDAGAQDNRKNEFHSLGNIIIVVLFQLRKLMLCSAVEYGCERIVWTREAGGERSNWGLPTIFQLFPLLLRHPNVLCSIGRVECTELR